MIEDEYKFWPDCQHEEWETVSYDTPILNVSEIANQQTSYKRCKKCGYEDRTTALFSFNAPCAHIGTMSED